VPQTIYLFDRVPQGQKGWESLLQINGAKLLFPHRSRKWYKRIFNHLVEAAVVNAHITHGPMLIKTDSI